MSKRSGHVVPPQPGQTSKKAKVDEKSPQVKKSKKLTKPQPKPKTSEIIKPSKPESGLLLNAESQKFGALSSVVKRGELTDLELRLNDSKIVPVHRLVLAAMSKPLRTKVEMNDNKDVLDLRVYSIDAFEKLLDYAYGVQFLMSDEDKDGILDLLKTACEWCVDSLRDKCVDYLIKTSELNSATRVLMVSESLGLSTLAEAAAKTVAMNISRIENKNKYFDCIPDSAFKKIFTRADLDTSTIEGEMAIVDLIFARTQKDEMERTDDLLESCVKFVDLNDRQLLTLSLDERFNTLNRRRIILDAISVNKFPNLINEVANKNGEACATRFKTAPYMKHRGTSAQSSLKRWSFINF